MSISVNNAANPANPISAMPVRAPSPERGAFKALGQALRAGDVDAAKAAYADIVKNAPDGASVQRHSAFADIGKALANGNVDVAQAAFGRMVQNAVGKTPPGSVPPMPVPVASSTGGVAGTTVNTVA